MARKKGREISGWLIVDKPAGVGSTDVVGRVRWALDAKKAGHAGTLDPDATGVLAVALGEATKTVPLLTDALKAYDFTVNWGVETDTDDASGTVTGQSDARPSADAIRAALPAFIGEIMQVPPAFSAVKVDGERAYDLARDGEEVELEARPVEIDALRIVSHDGATTTFEAECGKGTYVRAIVRDIAERLGACAHVSALRRTRVGPFDEDSAITLELLEDLGHKARCLEALLPVETALDDIPELAVTTEDAFKLKQGRPIVLVPRQVEVLKARLSPGTRTVSAMEGGSIVALCEMRAGKLEPSRVFHLEKSGD